MRNRFGSGLCSWLPRAPGLGFRGIPWTVFTSLCVVSFSLAPCVLSESVNENEPNNRLSSANFVTPPTTLYGNGSRFFDVDNFKVRLCTGGTLRVSYDGLSDFELFSDIKVIDTLNLDTLITESEDTDLFPGFTVEDTNPPSNESITFVIQVEGLSKGAEYSLDLTETCHCPEASDCRTGSYCTSENLCVACDAENFMAEQPKDPDGFCPSVKQVDLSSASLSSIAGFTFPLSVMSIDLSFNSIHSVDVQALPPMLSTINLRGNQLTSIGTAWPSQLLLLEVSGNNLTSIPLTALPRPLERLIASDNAITAISGTCPPNMTQVTLDDNLLTTFNVALPEQLQVLRIKNNNMSSLNATWPSSMQEIDLSLNALTSLHGQQWPEALDRLFLNNNLLTSLSYTTWPTQLIAVALDSNHILSLNCSVSWPRSVQVLSLSNNGITTLLPCSLPSDIAELYLDRNRISTVSAAGTWPRTLTYLNLARNLLADDAVVNFQFEFLPVLTGLDLSFNLLSTLEGLSFPESLLQLDVSHNRIDALPRRVLGPELTSFFGNGNPWFDVADAIFLNGEQKTPLALVADALPCSTRAFISHELWYCDASIPDPPCTLDGRHMADYCELTQAGERLYSTSPAIRERAVSNANQQYAPFYYTALPACVAFTIICRLMWGKRYARGCFFWFVWLVASFDLATDWAFVLIEMSSTEFANALECEQPGTVGMRCSVNGFTAPHSCIGYAALQDPCLGAGIGLTECECFGFQCAGDGQCLTDSASLRQRAFAASSSCEQPLNAAHASVCGMLGPDATGSNECECNGGQCTNPFPGTCTGLVTWNAHWLFIAACSSVAVSTLITISKAAVGAGSCGFEDDEKSSVLANHAIASFLLEDAPQLFFQIVYVTVLDITASPLALLSTCTTGLSLLLALIMLANRYHDVMVGFDDSGLCCTSLKAVFLIPVMVFSCFGLIPKCAANKANKADKADNCCDACCGSLSVCIVSTEVAQEL